MVRKSKSRKSKSGRTATGATSKPRATRTTKASAAGNKRGRQRGTEVERRWAEYLEHRTALETAVESVRVATEALNAAREIETTRRRQFDESRRTLEQLLDVDAAQRGAAQRDRGPSDLPRPAGKPARDKGEERLPLPS